MPVVTIASTAASTSTATATTSIIIALDASASKLIGMAVLAQAIIGGLSTIVYAAGVTVTKGCLKSRSLAVFDERPARYCFTVVPLVKKGENVIVKEDIPCSFPWKPPRRPPRPPRWSSPRRASVGAVPEASRLPLLWTGLSAILVGGAGSLSESWSLSLPV